MPTRGLDKDDGDDDDDDDSGGDDDVNDFSSQAASAEAKLVSPILKRVLVKIACDGDGGDGGDDDDDDEAALDILLFNNDKDVGFC
jgi:hypothetical protein